VVKAAAPLEDPTAVTGAQVREAMGKLNVASGTVVRTGTDALKLGIDAIGAGTDINYEGASGPCDLDAVGDVKAKVTTWQVKDSKFLDLNVYDCITSSMCTVEKKN
jgi:hypothetical protein